MNFSLNNINVIQGNVLSIKEGIIVHGCNTHGVMGSGIAYTIKNKYPKAYDLYRQQYEANGDKLYLGDIQIINVEPNKYIINAMTQDSFGKDGNRYVCYDAIAECFKKVNNFALDLLGLNNPLPVCFPKIGAGLGGGDWNIIEKIIKENLAFVHMANLYVI